MCQFRVSRHVWRFFLFASVFTVPSSIAALPGDAARDDLARYQGTWSVESSVFDGKAVSVDVTKSIQMIVTDDHVVWKRDGKSFAGTKIGLDPKTMPQSIDVIPDGGRYMGEHVLGIYRFDDKLLIICMASPGKPRPSEFKSDKGSGCTLRVFQRVAKTSP